MQIPKVLKIGGCNWEVINSDVVYENECLGLCDPNKLEIILEEKLIPEQKKLVFVHEIVEAIMSLCEIEIEHKDITNISNMLHQIIVDNKEIFSDE